MGMMLLPIMFFLGVFFLQNRVTYVLFALLLTSYYAYFYHFSNLFDRTGLHTGHTLFETLFEKLNVAPLSNVPYFGNLLGAAALFTKTLCVASLASILSHVCDLVIGMCT